MKLNFLMVQIKIMSKIKKAIKERILVLDGAMGTMLQRCKFSEEDFRGSVLRIFHTPSKEITIYYRLRNLKQ